MEPISRWTVHAGLAAALMAVAGWLAESTVETQSPQDGMRQRSIAAEKTGLAEPFKGVTHSTSKSCWRAGLTDRR